MLELPREKVLQDAQMARKQFERYESLYQELYRGTLAYLRENSVAYKQAILAVQGIILPAVRKHCSVCAGRCCHLYLPEHQIYIARTVGCFSGVDYLLARCDADFPTPRYENVEQNLCAFWDNGCRLPLDSRSQVCIKYFCDDIRQDLMLKN